MKLYIGTSGYNYKHWVDVFYPKDLPSNRWLEFYSQNFNAVELNVTFYRLPNEGVFLNWYKRTPKNFKFVVKGWRFITHLKKLADCQEELKMFFGKIENLKNKLICVLWQLPPSLKFEQKKLENFVLLLKKYPYFYSFEFRNESWFNNNVYQIFKKNDINLCIADSPNFPTVEEITSSFIYLRFHGKHNLYASDYSEEELKVWVEKLKSFKEKKKIKFALVFFNNDAFGYAPKNAIQFKNLYGNL